MPDLTGTAIADFEPSPNLVAAGQLAVHSQRQGEIYVGIHSQTWQCCCLDLDSGKSILQLTASLKSSALVGPCDSAHQGQSKRKSYNVKSPQNLERKASYPTKHLFRVKHPEAANALDLVDIEIEVEDWLFGSS